MMPARGPHCPQLSSVNPLLDSRKADAQIPAASRGAFHSEPLRACKSYPRGNSFTEDRSLVSQLRSKKSRKLATHP
jgi:hypothetical protein